MTSTTTEPRTVEQIKADIEITTDLRTAATGAEKGKHTKALKALTAELAAATKKRGPYADLDDRIVALIAEGDLKDAAAVIKAIDDPEQPTRWRLMMLSKKGRIPAGQFWSPRVARTADEVVEAPAVGIQA